MTTKLSFQSISAALVLLGSAALVACGGGPDKVDSPVDQQTPPTDQVEDPTVPTDPPTDGAGGTATEDPKTEEPGAEAKDGEDKPGDAAKEAGEAKEKPAEG